MRDADELFVALGRSAFRARFRPGPRERNHPVFVAQHATAPCCRGCLEKWHRIPHGRALDAGPEAGRGAAE